MQSTFTLRKDELNMDFLKGLKKMFSGKTLNITVSDNKTDEQDETEYLLSNPVNKQMLLDGIAAIEKGDVTKVKLETL
ncbi:hypothetical protein [uncultured Treponema sp.]|uniref:hypothetical protein n=1 Tax=uncultured Treponema sp. TaxID=162155 RepID=UPI0025FECE3B|nr:hypothetical protein [uncultured Treponema sp.]